MSHTKPVNIYLNSQAVRELIKLDEEPMLQLAHHATAQIAEALQRKLTKEALDDRLDNMFRSSVFEGWTPRLQETAKRLMSEFLKAKSEEFVAKIEDDTIKNIIREHVIAALNLNVELFKSRMNNQIDAMLRARFAVMFGTPPTLNQET